MSRDQNGSSITLDDGGITLTSSKDITLKASGDLKVEGPNVELKASASFKAGSPGNVCATPTASRIVAGMSVIVVGADEMQRRWNATASPALDTGSPS